MWLGLFCGLLFSMGFVNQTQNALKFKSLEVRVNQDDDLYFLDNNDVVQLLYNRGDSIVGRTKAKINVPAIERIINSHEDVANAEVSATIDGKLKIRVTQRKPIIRIMNMLGESYYIDDEGKLMMLSDKYTANVLLANGTIYESFARNYTRPVTDTIKGKSITPMLCKLFVMAKYIHRSKFWNAQIQQIYVNQNKELELVPMVGDQKIIFGDTTDMAEKFEKLHTFYLQGLNTTGSWNKYSVINLKYKNQIVCTKKIY
jgi:cell division protein FtsQ